MSRHSDPVVRRLPVLVLVPAALLAGAIADRSPAPAAPAVTAGVQAAPSAPPVDAYSTSWFCAGASGSAMPPSADAPTGEIFVYNDSTRAETGAARIVSSSGSTSTVAIQVEPGTTEGIPDAVAGGGRWTGAVVTVDGSAAVEEVLTGPLGVSLGQCATSGSRNWYLPTGQTRVNASETVLLLNPYPTDSIVDLSFTTDQGEEQPQQFEDVTVPAGALVGLDLGRHLRRRSAIATTVTARFGRVVAWSEEIVTPPQSGEPIVGTPAARAPLADPAAAVAGVSLGLGAPSRGTTWQWPDGLAGNGVDEEYVVYNPGSASAEVSLSIGLEQGTAEPFELSIGPGQVVPVVSEQQTRIPAGSPHTARLTSTNGVPVVAERAVAAADPGAPGGGLQGIAAMLGERAAYRRWVVPWSGTDSSHRGQLVVYNPGPVPATVTVTGAGASPQVVTVPAAGRQAVAVGPPSAGPVVVVSDQAVYVEYDLYADGATGYSLGPAVPVASS